MVALYFKTTKKYHILISESIASGYRTFGITTILPTADQLNNSDFLYFNEESNEWFIDKTERDDYLTKQGIIKTTKVADYLDKNAELAIAQDYVTDGQVGRYKYKYEKALINKTDFFTNEAKAAGITEDDLINIVLKNKNLWDAAYEKYISLIEATRWKTKQYFLAKDFTKANRGLYFMKSLDPSWTYDHYDAYVTGKVNTPGELPDESS